MDKLKVKNITLYGKDLYYKQHCVITDERPMKLTNNKFCSFNSFEEFYKVWMKDKNKSDKPIYELIQNNKEHMLYWDLDSTNPYALDSFKKLLYSFTQDNMKYLFPFKSYDEFCKCLIISKCVRNKLKTKKSLHKGLYTSYSYHIVYRNNEFPVSCLEFKEQHTFNQYFINWIQNISNEEDFALRKNLYKTDIATDKTDIVIDLSVYPKNGKGQAFRTIYSSKDKEFGDSCLKPIDETIETRNYFATFINDKFDHQFLKCPDAWGLSRNITKKSTYQSDVIPVINSSEIPKSIERLAIKYFKQHHPEGKFVSSKITELGDYKFSFIDTCGKCLIHNRVHDDMTNNNYQVYYKDNQFLYYCYSASKDDIKPPMLQLKPKVDLVAWNYEYEDRVDLYNQTNDIQYINCLDCPSPEILTDGGTFVLQSNKGTGKSESLENMISELKEDKTVLLITYRRTLVSKYTEEYNKYGFTSYLDSKMNVKRLIVCLDSLHKFRPDFIGFAKYDVIIIDEIYSVLEHFDSNLMYKQKINVMMCFEKHLKSCNNLYCLDANIENKMVISVINKLRNPEKILWHKNPLVHNYTDYDFEFYETRKLESIPKNISEEIAEDVKPEYIKQEFIEKIIADLKVGKKLYIASSTKKFCDNLEFRVKELQASGDLIDFTTKLYTSETNSQKKDEDLKDVCTSWGNLDVRLVIASPTISAGISYNIIDEEKGFHKIYIYAKIGKNVSSMNTLVQQMIRVRQLIDKKFIMLYDNQLNDNYTIQPEDIKNLLYNQTEVLYENLSTPYKQSIGIDETTWKPIFDENCWTFSLWIEIQKAKLYYSIPKIFKKTIREKYCNLPNHPYANGYGMQWRDYGNVAEFTKDEHKEMVKKNNELIDSKKKITAENMLKLKVLTDSEFDTLTEKMRNKEKITDEEYQQANLHMLCKTLKINFDDIRNQWDTLDDKKKLEFIDDYNRLTNLDNKAAIRNNKIWTKKFNNNLSVEENIQDINEQYHDKINSCPECAFFNKDTSVAYNMKKVINVNMIASWWANKLQYVNSLIDVCDLFEIEKFKNLEGTVFQMSKFDTLLEDRDKIKIWYEHILTNNPDLYGKVIKDKTPKISSGIIWKDLLMVWQKNNMDKHIYDLKYEDFLAIPEFESALKKYVPEELKRKGFKKTSKSNTSNSKMCIENLANGGFITSELKKSCSKYWEANTFASALDDIFEKFGYKLINNGPPGKKCESKIIKYIPFLETVEKYKIKEINIEFD